MRDSYSAPTGMCPHGNMHDSCKECAKERDYFMRDLEYVDRVMVEGTEDEMAKLRAFLKDNGMDDRKIDLSIEARRLRRKVHEEMDDALRRRLAERPEPTDEERALGTYLEMIEPHVRDAVLALQRKGYRTRGSGFWDFNGQNIYCSGPCFKDLDAAAREKLAALGARVSNEDRIVSFEADEIDLGKLKARFDAIAAALPDRGAPAPPNEGKGNFEALLKRYGPGRGEKK